MAVTAGRILGRGFRRGEGRWAWLGRPAAGDPLAVPGPGVAGEPDAGGRGADAVPAGAPRGVPVPSWRRDRAALLRYRLAAAGYGLRIRMMRPFGDVVGVAGLLAGLLPFAAVVTAHWRAYGEVLIGVMAVAAWPAVRYLGSIGGMMRAAASTEEGTRRVFEDMREGMANPAGYALLRWIYRPVVEEANQSLAGQGWPCRLEFTDIASPDLAAPPAQFASVILRTAGLAELADLLGNLRPGLPDARRAARRAESRQRLMRRWRALLAAGHAVNDEDGRNYCLAEIRLQDKNGKPGLVLDLGIAEYGQIARTCEALVNEYALFAFLIRGQNRTRRGPAESGGPAMRPSTALRCMPWRQKAHDGADSAAALFLRPRHRAAGLGVAVATVTADGGEPRVFVGERSGTVGTYPNVLHVIPAGNCNTHGSQRPIEHRDAAPLPGWYLRTIMRSEYLEEWFNDADLEVSRFPDWAERVDRGWAGNVREITPITLTGIAFDLLNLRPEVCAVTEVEMTRTEVLNWEFQIGSPPEAWPLRAIGDIRPPQIVQGGAAVLLLAQASLAGRPQNRSEQRDRP